MEREERKEKKKREEIKKYIIWQVDLYIGEIIGDLLERSPPIV
jgi:hypothetical protein